MNYCILLYIVFNTIYNKVAEVIGLRFFVTQRHNYINLQSYLYFSLHFIAFIIIFITFALSFNNNKQ